LSVKLLSVSQKMKTLVHLCEKILKDN